jgi:hypothetical protein
MVVAVGSNASPAVLSRKFARAGLDPTGLSRRILPVRIEGMTVSHSAHVARGGYIPATPYRSAGGGVDTSAAWLTASELAALDQTEPNYQRMTVNSHSFPLYVASEPLTLSFHIYVSRHGVLGSSPDTPIPFGPQRSVLAWLSDRLGAPLLAGPAADVCDVLGNPTRAASITDQMRTRGLRFPAGVSGHGVPSR